MKNYVFYIASILIINFTNTYAFTEDEINPVAALRAGVNWINVSQNDVNTVGLGDDRYTRDKNAMNASWGTFVGGEWELPEKWFLRGGLAYDFLDRTNIEGDIYLTENPSLNDLDYQYKLQHQRLNGEFILLKGWHGWYPYISGALGIAWNSTKDYKETSNNSLTPATDYLEGQNTTDFTWSVGAGLERYIWADWRISLGYVYTDAGTAQLKSKISEDTLEQRFSMQQLMLQVSYVFD